MMWIGKLFHWLGFPAMVSPMRFYDNGTLVEITTSPYYTKITVNNKEFFFNRESGKYDGVGEHQPQ